MLAHEIKQRLVAAQEQLERVAQALRTRCQADVQGEYWVAHDAVLALERELAATKGEEHAVPLDFPVKWNAGCPLPRLLCDDHKVLLTFTLREKDSGWDGTTAETVRPAHIKAPPLALVEFTLYSAVKLGSPNDEVFHGHPLQGRGLDGYTAQRVVNSRWLAEVETINKVHRGYNPTLWRELNHYVFWFHDRTFECIAKSFKVEVYQESMAAVLTRMCERLLS